MDTGAKEALQALFALPELPMPGSHGAADQWNLLRFVLEDFNIWNKTGHYTGDYHTALDITRLLDSPM